jgi:hypothetical protein
VDALKENKCLTKVKFESAEKESDEHKDFKKEIEFYVKRIAREKRVVKEMEERQEECSDQ